MVAANRYTVDLFEVGGGVARVFEGGDRLEIALAIYQSALVKHPDKLVMLCDQSHVLARSDQRPSVPDGITLLKRGVLVNAWGRMPWRMPVEEQQRRKRALIKGLKEFRDIREDLPKPKT